MKILNDLRLKLEKPIWALDPELALIDTILNENPRLYEIIAADIMELNKDSEVGRQETVRRWSRWCGQRFIRNSGSWNIESLNMRRKIRGSVERLSNWGGEVSLFI
jgi:hypothetical protein